jgi:hypothetical protein
MATPLFEEDLLVLVQAPSRMQVGHSIGILWFKTNGVFKINKKLMMHHLN